MATFPDRVLATLNAVLVKVADALFGAAVALAPLASLLLLALATAAAIVGVVAWSSDQRPVRQTKRGIQAALFEIRLFNDDPHLVLCAVRDALRHNLTYLRLSLVPVAILSLPLVLLVTHLNPFYGYTGLEPGTSALIDVQLRTRGPDAAATGISLEAPHGVDVEAGPAQFATPNEWVWRIKPMVPGHFTFTIRVNEAEFTKAVAVSGDVVRRSPARVPPGIISQLLHPSEPPLDPAGPVTRIAVSYPSATWDILGVPVHWTVLYGALTMLCAFALGRVVGVTL